MFTEGQTVWVVHRLFDWFHPASPETTPPPVWRATLTRIEDGVAHLDDNEDKWATPLETGYCCYVHATQAEADVAASFAYLRWQHGLLRDYDRHKWCKALLAATQQRRRKEAAL